MRMGQFENQNAYNWIVLLLLSFVCVARCCCSTSRRLFRIAARDAAEENKVEFVV